MSDSLISDQDNSTEIHRGDDRDNYDPLTTHAVNGEAIDPKDLLQTIEDELARIKNRKEALTIGMIGLDQYEAIHDALGVEMATRVASHVAHVVTHTLRKSDGVTRLPSGQLLCLLRGNDLARGILATERVRHAICGIQFGWQATPIELTISAGVSQCQTSDTTPEVARRLEQGLRAAKNEGHNCILPADFF
jgi:diguanylate cyclase (GGDEF)-like protein